MHVEVVPHDPAWQHAFEKESGEIRGVLADNLLSIHHIGSTAIAGIYAKPVIDFLVGVADLARLDEQAVGMTRLGYEAMGELGIPGRRYFRRDREPGLRSHNVHAFEEGSPGLARHIAFRDYMIAHPAEAREYSDLKRGLAKKFPDDIEAYMDGKDAYIKTVETRAIEWKRSLEG